MHWKVEEEEIELEYILTGDQVTDIMTKGLAGDKHTKFSKKMGMGHSL